MMVESAVVAEELSGASPMVHADLLRQLGKTPLSTLSHEQFKAATKGARAIVRTGEFSAYANVILRSGVVF
jgi:D-ribose pyranase